MVRGKFSGPVLRCGANPRSIRGTGESLGRDFDESLTERV